MISAIEPDECLVFVSQTRIDDCKIVRSDVLVNRKFIEMFDDLLRLFPFARHRVGVSKTGPYLCCALKRYRLLKGSNGLGKSALLLSASI